MVLFRAKFQMIRIYRRFILRTMKNPWTYVSVVLFLLCANFISSKTQKTTVPMKFRTEKALHILSNEFNDLTVLNNHLQHLLVPRMPGTPSHRQAGDYIIFKMEELGWTIEVDEFTDSTPYGPKTFRNIIATYDPSLPRRLVLSAHYDSKNISDARYPNMDFIGATDSSVPCAMLLDVATQLTCSMRNMNSKDRKSAKDITPQLVFFDGEEAYKQWTATDSLYGSRHLAQKWRNMPHPSGDPSKTYLDSIVLFVLLDLIGTADVNFHSFFYNTDNYFEHLVKLEKNMLQNGNTNSEGVRNRYTRGLPQNMFHSSKMNQGLLGSHGIEDDHIPFKNDVPVLHLISYPFPSVWHEMTDNGDALDYTVIDNINRIFRVFVSDFLQLDAFLKDCRRIKK